MRRREEERRLRLGFLVGKLLSGEAVSVDELCSVGKGVDKRTARGDLIALSQLRTPRRLRGGLAPANALYSDAQRTRHLEAKQDVAEAAAGLLDTNASIAASAGSTVAMTYSALIEQGVPAVIITNSLSITEDATSPGSPVYVVGGEYNANVDGLVGPDAVEGFRRRSPCRQGLLGVSGVTVGQDLQATLYVRHDAEVPVLRAMLNAVTEKLVIVANVQKLGQGDPWQIGTLAELAKGKRQVVLVSNLCKDWKEDLGGDWERAKLTSERLLQLEQHLGKKQGGGFEFLSVPRQGSSPMQRKGGASKARSRR